MRFNFFSLLLIAVFTFGFSFFVKNVFAKTQVIDRIYLIVNSQMLTRSEAHDVASAIQSQHSSGEKTKKELDEMLLENLVQELLLLDRAQALRIVPGVKEIDSRLNQLADEQPQLLEVYPEEELKDQLVRDYKKQKIINREVDSKIRIEPLEINLFCEKQLRQERKVGLAQILLQGSDEEIRQKISTIRRDFESGITFEELAKLHSVDASAKRTGGKLGIYKPEDLLAEIGEATQNLKLGEISNVVQTSLGKHLLYIYKEEIPKNLDCTDLSVTQTNKYSNALYSQKRGDFLEIYMDELYACANIEIKEPGTSGLPTLSSLPKAEKGNVNCQARRVMVLPQKKKKEKKEKQRRRKLK